MSREDYENGKPSNWTEMEIRGPIKNLSSDLWTFTHLTSLYLNDNNLQVSVICKMAVCEVHAGPIGRWESNSV